MQKCDVDVWIKILHTSWVTNLRLRKLINAKVLTGHSKVLECTPSYREGEFHLHTEEWKLYHGW